MSDLIRLRNTRTGVVINVDEVTASRLDATWKDADAPDETPDSPSSALVETDGGGNPVAEPAKPDGADAAPGDEVSDETQGEGGDDVQSGDDTAPEPEDAEAPEAEPEPAKPKRSRYRN